MATAANPFPYGADTEVQHTKRDGVDVFVFTHHPKLRRAPRPPGRPRSIDPTAEARRLDWSMTTLRDRLVKIGAKIVRHGRSITFQMAEVMVPGALFQKILAAIAALRPLPPARC